MNTIFKKSDKILLLYQHQNGTFRIWPFLPLMNFLQLIFYCTLIYIKNSAQTRFYGSVLFPNLKPHYDPLCISGRYNNISNKVQ